MTQKDLQNQKEEIAEKYRSLGGVDNLLSEFVATLSQSVDFEMNESWVETPLDLVDQWMNDRYRGAKQKVTLADTIASINEKNGNADKYYSTLDKKYI